MDLFDQLIDLAHEAKDRYEEFLKANLNPTMEQADANYHRSKEVCKSIQEKLDGVKTSKDGSGFDYDRCVYHMAKDIINMHEYLALLIFMSNLREKLSQSAKQKNKKEIRIGSKAYNKHGRQGSANRPEQMPETRTKQQSNR